MLITAEIRTDKPCAPCAVASTQATLAGLDPIAKKRLGLGVVLILIGTVFGATTAHFIQNRG